MNKLENTKVSKYCWFAVLSALFLLVIFMPNTAQCSKHSAKTLPPHRWREVKRLNTDSVSVSFLDTMFLTIKPKMAFTYHNKNAFVYNGIYILDGKELDFGYAKFFIVSKKPTSMLLKDAHGFYMFGIDSTDTLKTIVLPKEEKLDTVITIDQMIGHWTAYKRIAQKQLDAVDHTTQIKTIIITGPSSDGKLGYVFADADKADSPSWNVIKLNKNLTLDCEGKTKRTLKVDKCQNGELILEDEEIKYYFKQYK